MIVATCKTCALFLIGLSVVSFMMKEFAFAQGQVQSNGSATSFGPLSHSSDPKSPTSTSASQATGAPKQSNILDFEADVIEGERSGPSILIQMDLQAPNLDTLVFQRKNFNDFHAIDMKRKPRYRGK